MIAVLVDGNKPKLVRKDGKWWYCSLPDRIVGQGSCPEHAYRWWLREIRLSGLRYELAKPKLSAREVL